MTDGYTVFPYDDAVARWADAAAKVAKSVLAGDVERRHGGTWFVGVDALPNAPDGSVGGVPLGGTWMDHVTSPNAWHRAQLSVIFPGYPRQDPCESNAAQRYRRNRDAAHVDGLLPIGPKRRRYLREPHGFIAGLPLSDVGASPLVVWPGSHEIMQAAFADAFHGHRPSAWAEIDLTKIYQSARRHVFETCSRVLVEAGPGQVILLDRHLLHGVAPWGAATEVSPRTIAYFRPQIDIGHWL